jgi:hypothetical protein
VAGLGFGATALPAQLAKAHASSNSAPKLSGPPGAFSLCFGQSGGAMALGSLGASPGVSLQYVSLLQSGKGYYAVPVTNLLFDGRPLKTAQVGSFSVGAETLAAVACSRYHMPLSTQTQP